MTTNPTDRPDAGSGRRRRSAFAWPSSAVGVLFVVALAFFIVRALQEESRARKRWDVFEEIRVELRADDMSRIRCGAIRSASTTRSGRSTSARSRSSSPRPRKMRCARSAHALRDRQARADQVLSKDDLDEDARAEFWERARKHLEEIVDRYPEFQTNWSSSRRRAPPVLRARSWRRRIQRGWEKENLPRGRHRRPICSSSFARSAATC